MRQLVLHGRGDLRLREGPDLEPAAGQVRIAVCAAGVCGSDLNGYWGKNDRRAPGVVMGHEVSGTVDAVGAGTDLSLLGRRVVLNPVVSCGECGCCRDGHPNRCRTKSIIGCVPALPGGFADHLVAPATAVVPWDTDLPLTWGALVEPLAVGLHAAETLDLAGLDVVVIGGGAIGLCAALSTRRSGARSVRVVDPDRRRRELLQQLGFATAPAASGGPDLVHVVIDCVASAQSIAAALAQTLPAGTVVVVGLSRQRVGVPMPPLVDGERALRGSAQYAPDTFRRAAAWLSSGELDVRPLLREPVRLADAPALFAAWHSVDRPVKVLITP